MNRANQQALFQQTNQGLLGIRQAEINYYLNLNLAFGTQAALIGGFTYGVFTQNQLNEGNAYGETINDIYWVMSAATIAASVHVIINTMLLQVLGPGLALHGPVGSIVRATEGMKVEQKQIVTAFILMMMLFALSTTFSFWVVMNFESAVGSTVVFLIAARYWYYYTERIYLRFYWDADKNVWDEDEDGKDNNDDNEGGGFNKALSNNGKVNEDEDPAARVRNASPSDKDTAAGGGTRRKSTDSMQSAQGSSKPPGGGGGGKNRVTKFLSKLKLGKKGSKSDVNDSDSPSNASGGTASPFGSASGNVKLMAMEGYLTKSAVSMQIDAKKDPWERRYFTLNRAGLMYYYKSRLEYRQDPRCAMLNKRPLILSEYYVHVANTDEHERLQSVDGGGDGSDDGPGLMHRTSYNFFATASVTDSVAASTATTRQAAFNTKHCFEMTLIRKDEKESLESRRWILRCDTEEELQVWISTMKTIARHSFPEADESWDDKASTIAPGSTAGIAF